MKVYLVNAYAYPYSICSSLEKAREMAKNLAEEEQIEDGWPEAKDICNIFEVSLDTPIYRDSREVTE